MTNQFNILISKLTFEFVCFMKHFVGILYIISHFFIFFVVFRELAQPVKCIMYVRILFKYYLKL